MSAQHYSTLKTRKISFLYLFTFYRQKSTFFVAPILKHPNHYFHTFNSLYKSILWMFFSWFGNIWDFLVKIKSSNKPTFIIGLKSCKIVKMLLYTNCMVPFWNRFTWKSNDAVVLSLKWKRKICFWEFPIPNFSPNQKRPVSSLGK